MRIGYPRIAAERAQARARGLTVPPRVPKGAKDQGDGGPPLAERDTDDENLTPAERIAIYQARALQG